MVGRLMGGRLMGGRLMGGRLRLMGGREGNLIIRHICSGRVSLCRPTQLVLMSPYSSMLHDLICWVCGGS